MRPTWRGRLSTTFTSSSTNGKRLGRRRSGCGRSRNGYRSWCTGRKSCVGPGGNDDPAEGGPEGRFAGIALLSAAFPTVSQSLPVGLSAGGERQPYDQAQREGRSERAEYDRFRENQK